MILNSFGLRNIPEEKPFPFSLELIQNLETIKLTKPVTFFVGENGVGKSTILEGLAYASGVPAVGELRIDDDPLMEPARKLGKMMSLRYQDRTSAGFFVRAEDFLGFVKNILRSIAELDQEIETLKAEWEGGGDINLALGPLLGERKAYTDRYTENFNAMSHGEGFLHFFKNRITGKGLYLIDEPEAALSPARQLSLIKIILDGVKRGSQFIIATHSPIIMAMPDAQILEFADHKITEVVYKETGHYQLSKAFFDAPEVFFKELGKED